MSKVCLYRPNHRLLQTSSLEPSISPLFPPPSPPRKTPYSQPNSFPLLLLPPGKKLGEGTFAIVYLAHLRSTPDHLIAIKKFKIPAAPDQRSDGLNVDSIREIKYLQELSHPSIISLLDVFSTKDQSINMVIEYFPHGNLEQLIKDRRVAYGAADVKAWMAMLARALHFCHHRFVLHRDIKPNNLLIAADGQVKLADFGLARAFADPYANMSHVVITLWYRPPELLFGARHYSGKVDVWSMGMVFAELLLRVPYAATMSDKEIAQLETICDAVGTPREENWPGVSTLPNYVEMDRVVPVRGREYYMAKFPTAGGQGVDLLMAMLKLDPRERASAREVLEHAWWRVEPKPTERENLPRQGGGGEKMGESEARQPGVVAEEDRFQGVARRLEFGALK